MVTAKQIINSIKQKRTGHTLPTPLGEVGYDNPRDDLEKIKNLREGTIFKVPANAKDIVNKEYCDSNSTTYTAGDHLTLTGSDFDVDDDFLKNSEADVGVSLTLTGDNSSADTAYVPMVLYNTDATPPAASGFPIGTLYVQYTA